MKYTYFYRIFTISQHKSYSLCSQSCINFAQYCIDAIFILGQKMVQISQKKTCTTFVYDKTILYICFCKKQRLNKKKKNYSNLYKKCAMVIMCKSITSVIVFCALHFKNWSKMQYLKYLNFFQQKTLTIPFFSQTTSFLQNKMN